MFRLNTQYLIILNMYSSLVFMITDHSFIQGTELNAQIGQLTFSLSNSNFSSITAIRQ